MLDYLLHLSYCFNYLTFCKIKEYMHMLKFNTVVITIYRNACTVLLGFLSYDERLYLIYNCTYMVDTLWIMFVLWHCILQRNWLSVEWYLVWCCLLTHYWINLIIEVYPIYTLNTTFSLSYLTPIRHWSLAILEREYFGV